MIVRLNSRGKGLASGPINYLLGKDRNRPHASVLSGDVDLTSELINGLEFKRRYTSGCLSFKEENLSEALKKELMQSFEEAIFCGLSNTEYDVCWIEHLDKGRLELNFLIPNVHLPTGRRLQPYWDRADRKRINAWQQWQNAKHNFHDPNDPANKRALTYSRNLPQDRKEIVETITNHLLQLTSSGAINDRNDIVTHLKNAGFEIARETKQSISIACPQGGKNIRLKGEIYERHFKVNENTGKQHERVTQQYSGNRKERAAQFRSEYQKFHEYKSGYNQRKYKIPSNENVKGVQPKPQENPNADKQASNPDQHDLFQRHSRRDGNSDGASRASPRSKPDHHRASDRGEMDIVPRNSQQQTLPREGLIHGARGSIIERVRRTIHAIRERRKGVSSWFKELGNNAQKLSDYVQNHIPRKPSLKIGSHRIAELDIKINQRLVALNKQKQQPYSNRQNPRPPMG